MGSIAALRSEAMALRAKENTEFEVSAYLGSVNKGLGTQINGMIDQLQNVINQRTKAYNGSVSNLKKSLEGKGGICDQMVLAALDGVSSFIKIVLEFDLTALVGGVIKGYFGGAAMKDKIQADIYNYEKMVSQIGFTMVDPSTAGPQLADAGTYTLLQKRDSLTPRYKSKDARWKAAVNPNGIYSAYTHNNNGYVGTLRSV